MDREQEIRERCKDITRGPWLTEGNMQVYPAGTPPHWRDSDRNLVARICQPNGDSEFIAHSREDVPYLLEELSKQRKLLAELFEVAELRGDNDLPHPSDDPKLWTARMQTAWDEIAAFLAETGGQEC